MAVGRWPGDGVLKTGWTTKTYGEVFSFFSTASYSRSELSTNNEYGYIHYGDIHTLWDDFLDVNLRELPSIDEEQAKGYMLLRDGDLIMADASEDYAGIGKSIELKGISNKKVIAGLHTLMMRDNQEAFINGFRGYIHLFQSVKKQLDKLATGLKVYGISKNNLKLVEIPIPPKAEQTTIATLLTDMDTEITQLQQRRHKTHALKQGMMQQLLTGKIRLI